MTNKQIDRIYTLLIKAKMETETGKGNIKLAHKSICQAGNLIAKLAGSYKALKAIKEIEDRVRNRRTK